MPGNSRPSGIDAVGNVPWGTHLCQFYRSEQDLLDIMVPYFQAGLESNEYCIWLTAEPLDVIEAARALREVLPDYDQYVEKGQIEIIPYTKWYYRDGVLDLLTVVDKFIEKHQDAKVSGYEGVRVAGDVTLVMNDHSEYLLEYEETVDNVIGDYRIIALCAYGVEKCEISELVDIVSKHQLALIRRNGKWVGIESAERKRAQEVLKRVYHELAKRFEERTAELARANSALQREIQERIQAEGALRKERDRAQQYLDVAGVMFVAIDADGKVTMINRKGCEVLGYPEEEIIGKNWFDNFLPSRVRKEVKSVAQKLLSGEIEATEYYENPVLTRSGDERIIAWNNVLIKNADGKIIGHLSSGEDITERKQAEEALLDSEERYSSLVDNIRLGIFRSTPGPEGHFLEVNPGMEEVTGYSRDELLKMNVTDLYVYPEERASVMKAAARGTGKVTRELNLRRKDGTEIVVSDTKFTILNENGEIAYFDGVLEDITERKQAENMLRESEERYRALFESKVDGTVVVGEDMKMLLANQAAADMFGFKSAEELYHLNLFDYVMPEERDRVFQLMTEDMFEKDLRRLNEFRCRKKSGEEIWVSAIGVLTEYQGRPAGVASIRDVTERKRMEEVARQHSEEMSALNVISSTLSQSLDLEVVLDTVLKRTMDLLAVEGGMICLYDSASKSLSPKVYQGISQKTLEDIAALKVEEGLTFDVAESAEPLIVSNIGDDSRGIRRATIRGKIRSYAGVPIRAGDNILGVMALVSCQENCFTNEHVDMLTHIGDQIGITTEKIRMYEEVMRSEEKLRLTFDSVRQGILVTDTEGRIVDANMAVVRMHGFECVEELIGLDIYQLIVGDDRERARENMQKTFEGGTLGSLEYQFLKKDGGEFPGNMNVAVMRDTSGDAVGFVAVIRDISRRKQIEKERTELEQRAQLASRLASIGQMASGVAHEINNPVASIIGFADLLLERDIPDDVREDVNVIHSEAERVASIVSKLLAFARRREPEMEYININDVVQTAIGLRLYELETNNIQINTLLDTNLPLTMADSNQLQQVFLNLILNAEIELKQLKSSGKLTIKTEVDDSCIRIYVTDNGRGIPEENLEKIFEPFFTTRKKDEGTGLGLSVCHGIITDHKGRITARNEPGVGATFIVELPIIEGGQQLEMPKPITEETVAVTSANILVVDDEPAVLKFLCRTLEEQGYNVDGVQDAKDVLLKLRNGGDDLILLDIKLPGTSGIELYKHMQKRTPALAKKVVFITGDIMGGDTRSFLSRTKAHYIVKPFSAGQLRKEVNGILATQMQEDGLHN